MKKLVIWFMQLPFIQRIIIDFREWRSYKQSIWNVKRDKRQIKQCIARAKIKNSNTGKTFYVLKDRYGNFNEVTNHEIKILKYRGIKIFPPYRDYDEMLRNCFAIVTSDEIIRNNYVETMNQNNKLENGQKEVL